MAIFVQSANLEPEVTNALANALSADAGKLENDVQSEAAKRSSEVIKAVSPKIAWSRLLVAIVIALALVAAAIYTASNNLTDISKGLMTSFQSFSGLVVGLLGGEFAASKK